MSDITNFDIICIGIGLVGMIIIFAIILKTNKN